MKRYLLLVLAISINFGIKSQTVDYNTALNIAENTITERFSNLAFNTEYKITSYSSENLNERTLIHIFNLEPNGFILISGDMSATPVLAFSTESNYNIDDKNAAVEFWTDTYKRQLNYNISNNILPETETINEWTRLNVSPSNFIAKSNIKAIEPLLHTTWDQGRYYNAQCPEDPAGTDGHTVVGCVATALGQLLNYFRYPQTGIGSYGYEHPDYGWIEVDFSQQTYDYDHMPVEPNDYNDNIARLLYNIGVSVDMNYGPDGSGMWNHKGAYTLYTYFDYNPSTTYLFKDSLPVDFDWNGTLVNHLDQNIPLYYAGWSDYDFISGHAFILDGYSDSTHYHINWGWGGSQDGYFVIDDLTPGGSDFTLLHEVIVNASPNTPTVSCTELKELNSSEGIIDDGSGPLEFYQNNTECTWLINPQDSISGISFKVLKLEMDEDDYIVVFDGENDTDPVITTIYGNSTIQEFESASERVLIKFVSNEDSVNDGWLISYQGIKPDYCNLSQTITDPTAVITDGSNSYLYQNNTFCNWIIQPDGAESIRVTFTEFDIEPIDDYIKILNSSNQTVANISGNTIPSPTTVIGDKITITFRSNPSVRYQGFSLYYEINKDGVDSEFANNFRIYPNPVTDYLTVAYKNLENINFLKIYSADGKLIRSINGKDFANERQINCSEFTNGIYLIEISDKNKTVRSRFVKI
jgi:hypothetical protein